MKANEEHIEFHDQLQKLEIEDKKLAEVRKAKEKQLANGLIADVSLQDLAHKTYRDLGDIVDMATDEEKYIFVTNKECQLIYIHLETLDE